MSEQVLPYFRLTVGATRVHARVQIVKWGIIAGVKSLSVMKNSMRQQVPIIRADIYILPGK